MFGIRGTVAQRLEQGLIIPWLRVRITPVLLASSSGYIELPSAE